MGATLFFQKFVVPDNGRKLSLNIILHVKISRLRSPVVSRLRQMLTRRSAKQDDNVDVLNLQVLAILLSAVEKLPLQAPLLGLFCFQKWGLQVKYCNRDLPQQGTCKKAFPLFCCTLVCTSPSSSTIRLLSFCPCVCLLLQRNERSHVYRSDSRVFHCCLPYQPFCFFSMTF